MFHQIPLHPESYHLTTISSPTHLMVYSKICQEGLAACPDYTSRVVQESLLLTNPSKSDLEEDKKKFDPERRDGKKRQINTWTDLEKALLKADKGDLPPSHTREHVPGHLVTEQMRNKETELARKNFHKKKRLAPVILREQMHPDLLPKKESAAPYIDEAILYTGSSHEHRVCLVSFLLVASNCDLLVSLDKFKPFEVYNGKGECKFLGFRIENQKYRPLEERVSSITSMQTP
jgi:hypothetical protein